VIVSSRETYIRRQTQDWVDRHYPGIFEEIYLCNHYLLNPEEELMYPVREKSDVCLTIGARLLVDDSLAWARDCAKKGMWRPI